MKKCSYCKQLKSLDDFGCLKSSKDGKQYRCKQCFSNRMRDIYKNDPKRKKLQVKLIERRIQDELNAMKRNAGCKYCKENEPICLDFHHENASLKEENVSHWVHRKSRSKAIEEAKKCIVVCSNCHRKLHNGILMGCKL
jgi:hypothetical protein